MRVAVICEFSGTVRDAFIRRGVEAVSFDILPSESDFGPHVTGDVRKADLSGFDTFICHPPCTYLCGMGVWWNHKRPERWALTDQAEEFFLWCYNLPGRVAVENPVGIMSTRLRKPDQVVNPWMFGQEFHKPTCLWLRGLPKLTPTQIVGRGEFYTKANGSRMSKWNHITSGTHKAKRASISAKTFQGIADAMADQWSKAI